MHSLQLYNLTGFSYSFRINEKHDVSFHMPMIHSCTFLWNPLILDLWVLLLTALMTWKIGWQTIQIRQRSLSLGPSIWENKSCHLLVPLSKNIKTMANNLGVWFNTNLIFEQYTTKLVQSCFCHLRNIIRPLVTAETILHARLLQQSYLLESKIYK